MPGDSLALAPVFCCVVSLHLFHDKQEFILCPFRPKTLTCLRGWLFFFFFLPKLSSWQDNKGAVRLHFESFLRFALRLR